MNRSMSILSALIMALSLWFGISPAHATPTLEPASLIATADIAPNSWRKMNVDSFPRTITAAVGQCERNARFSATDRLTAAHCETFQQKLEQNECVSLSVQDGQGYTFMNGPGRIYPGMTKRTGNHDAALRCDVGDSISIDWFNGQPGISCYNVGVIISPLPLPQQAVTDVPPLLIANPPAPRKSQCRMVTTVRQSQPTGGLFIPGLYLAGCCCGPLITNALWIAPSGSDNSSQTTLVCD